jgi:hypothetical protein
MPVSNSRCAYAWETNAANKVGYYYMSGTTFMVGLNLNF